MSTAPSVADRPSPPESRSVLPRSRAGRLWAVAALVVGPAVLLTVMEAPLRLFADRLPDSPVDRWGIERTPMADNHAAAAWWIVCVAAAWLTLLAVRFTSAGRVRRAGVWAGLIPLLYLAGGSLAGATVAQVLTNLDAERFGFARGAGPYAAEYAVLVTSLAAGALLTRQVIRHLPHPAPDRVRAAWVGTAPIGVPAVVAYAVIAALWLFLVGWVQTGEVVPAVIAAVLVLALWHWFTGTTDVAVTSIGVRVTSGALRPLRYTRTLSLADIRNVEVVHVSAARAVWATLWPRPGRCVFRGGPALCVHQRIEDRLPWLLGMESVGQAEQAAAAISDWRSAATG